MCPQGFRSMTWTNPDRLLAALHGIDYLTPSIVALAAKKVFRHRIIVAKPEDDRSLQYGSDLKTVAQVLSYATPDTILDSVLTLEAPLWVLKLYNDANHISNHHAVS